MRDGRMNGSWIVLALLVGMACGVAIAASGAATPVRIVAALEPIGTLWLNALRMTVIPLVVALLVTGIASAVETAATGRLAGRAIALFAAGYVLSVVIGAAFMQGALALWPLDAAARIALRAGAHADMTVVPAMPPPGEWLTGLIPVNPIASAVSGTMLPLVVFAVFFGFAAAKLAPAQRAPLVGFFRAVGEAMLVIVHWVLWAAPVGVFVLALGVGLRGGLTAAGGIVYYLVLLCAVGLLLTVLAYPCAVAFGRVSLVRFARAAAPAQVVAFSTQSSLASLPAMLTGARETLGVSERVSSITLPLAVTLFRVSSPSMNLAVVLFVAHVHGIAVGATVLAAGMLVAAVNSLSSVGLPGQTSFFTGTVPIALAMGMPLELLPVLLAVEVVPDIFRTVSNVTADLAVAAIVERSERPALASGQGEIQVEQDRPANL
ncbi:MAG: Proton/glutamate-aspartate symporter [Steroidobacteraceae bacterium]|nr:Proton/glutamate-aspartate symporter [Steroidobacteraceae bacterium]